MQDVWVHSAGFMGLSAGFTVQGLWAHSAGFIVQGLWAHSAGFMGS